MKVVSLLILAAAMSASAAVAQKDTSDLTSLSADDLPQQQTAIYEKPLVVGEALPEGLKYYPIPGHDGFSYTVVDYHRVIVETGTRKIVRVVD